MKNKGFTLIELIVVITILAILGTIAFIGFKGYTGDARNSKITTDISNLNNALGILKATEGFVPMPDSSVKVESGAGNTITFEGEVGDNVRSTLKASKDMVSPTGENYKYAVNGNQKQFTLVAELEEETANLSSSVYAADEKVKMFKGDKIVTLFDVNGNFVGGDIESLGSDNFEVFLGDEEMTILSGVVKNIPIEIKGNKKFIGQWKDFDSNCPLGDVVIGNQTWAGCNSTLGNGFERGKKSDGTDGIISVSYGCFDYDGNLDNSKCNPGEPKIFSSANPKDFFNLMQPDGINSNGDSEFNTIWGKLYTWSNSSSACPSGWHVPSDKEWEILETALNGGTSCRNGTDRGCDGLGWNGHSGGLKNDTNNLANALKIPLSAFREVNGSTFDYRGHRANLWTSTESGSEAYRRRLDWNNSAVHRYPFSKDYGFSVRCIKN